MTLAHELAHLYSHLGRDADGGVWRDPGFGQSDQAVIEGLAQHYAAIVSERLSARANGAFDAYRKLLAHQSGPYRAHETWFTESVTQRAEIVRFAMLRARNVGKITDAKWREMLAQAAKDLKRS